MICYDNVVVRSSIRKTVGFLKKCRIGFAKNRIKLCPRVDFKTFRLVPPFDFRCKKDVFFRFDSSLDLIFLWVILTLHFVNKINCLLLCRIKVVEMHSSHSTVHFLLPPHRSFLRSESNHFEYNVSAFDSKLVSLLRKNWQSYKIDYFVVIECKDSLSYLSVCILIRFEEAAYTMPG